MRDSPSAIFGRNDPMVSQAAYRPPRDSLTRAVGLICGVLWIVNATAAEAQLRVVTYNTTVAPRADMDIILKSIGEESRNGIAKPIDILLLQEQNHPATTGADHPSTDTAAFLDLLNNTIYQTTGITYAMGNTTGAGDTTQSIIYRVQSIQTVTNADQTTIANSGPRDTLRYRVRPVGYTTAAADLYIYNSHYKASLDASPPGTNASQRNSEATNIRTNSNSLVTGVNAINAATTTSITPTARTRLGDTDGQWQWAGR